MVVMEKEWCTGLLMVVEYKLHAHLFSMEPCLKASIQQLPDRSC